MSAVFMMKSLITRWRGRSRHLQAGQAHTEYGIILILIGITVIGSLTLMGHTVYEMFHNVTTAMPR